MAESVDKSVVDAITISGVSSIAEAGSISIANLFQHQTNHARRLDMLAEAHLAKCLDNFASVDPYEAVAISKLFKGEADSSVSSLLSQLAAGQVAAKTAQSTPGDISGELAKLTVAIAGMQAEFGGLVSSLQQIIKAAQTTR